jgi:hypothetical protein
MSKSEKQKLQVYTLKGQHMDSNGKVYKAGDTIKLRPAMARILAGKLNEDTSTSTGAKYAAETPSASTGVKDAAETPSTSAGVKDAADAEDTGASDDTDGLFDKIADDE